MLCLYEFGVVECRNGNSHMGNFFRFSSFECFFLLLFGYDKGLVVEEVEQSADFLTGILMKDFRSRSKMRKFLKV